MIWVPNEEELDDLAVSDCRAFEGFMQNMQSYSTSFTWFTGIFTSLFEFWIILVMLLSHVEATGEHAGPTNDFK